MTAQTYFSHVVVIVQQLGRGVELEKDLSMTFSNFYFIFVVNNFTLSVRIKIVQGKEFEYEFNIKKYDFFLSLNYYNKC
jgi:hypothetical protein